MEFVNDTLESIQHSDGRLLMMAGDTTPHYQYRIADHLGNTVVFFEDKNGDGFILDTIDIANDSSEVLMKKLYYPFGMDLEGVMPSVTSPLNRYKYNGKEELEGIGWYDYGARMYDASIGRWTNIDPLADSYVAYSAYNYVLGNPISLTDPDGRSVDSPIFGEDGTFLGVDSEGFKGDIIVMNQYIYEKLSEGGTKVLDHNSVTALTDNSSISNVLSDAELTPKELSNILTTVVSKIEDVDFSNLYNGGISVRDNITGEEFNDPTNFASLANVDVGELNKSGKIKVTAYLYGGFADSDFNTVEQVQNTLGIHEYQGHGVNKFRDVKHSHHKAYELQMVHSTFKRSTTGYQNYIEENYKAYLYKENPSKYKRIYWK